MISFHIVQNDLDPQKPVVFQPQPVTSVVLLGKLSMIVTDSFSKADRDAATPDLYATRALAHAVSLFSSMLYARSFLPKKYLYGN